MKKLLLMLGLAAMSVTSFAQDSILERIAGELLSDRFGVDVRDVLGIRRDRNQDVFDLGPTLSMSRYGGTSASRVQQLRASGMGWGQIAHEIGMHPGTFNKLRKQGYFDREPFWDDVFRRRYGVSQSEIDGLRGRGGRLEDILGAVIVSRSSGRRAGEVFDRYRQDRSWTTTSKRYNVDLKNWERVGKKVGWDGGSNPGKSVGSSKSSSKSTVKSKGNSGNAKGKGQSNAGGKGKGKGKGKGGGSDL